MKAIILITFLSCFRAYGEGFYAEPFVNRYSASLEQTFIISQPTVGTSTYNGKASGFQFGARAGYAWDKFYLGYQYAQTSGGHKDQELVTRLGLSSSSIDPIEDFKFDKKDYGLLFGWRFGEMFRMWFSALTARLETKDSDGIVTKYKGTTGLFGFGWMIKHGVSINLELGGTIYSEENGNEYPYAVSSGGVTMTADEFKEAAIMFGVSWVYGVYGASGESAVSEID